jgi:RND family efflux transporter MFP subunit
MNQKTSEPRGKRIGLRPGLWLLGGLALLAGCSKAPEQASAKPEVIAVRVVEIGATANQRTTKVLGTAAWRKETPLGFTSAGQIDRILVNEGDRVRPGQLLAQLKTTQVGAELAVAQAQAARAAGELARVRALFAKGWVTKQRLEAAEADARSADAAVQARRFALDTARINAPSGGVVLARLAEPNQVVGAAAPVLVLGEAGAGYVLRAPINDRIAAQMIPGLVASVRFEALGGAILQGRIVEIGAKANSTTGTFDVEIALPADPRLKSGMIGSAEIVGVGANLAPLLQVPASALIAPRAGEAVVFVLGTDNTVVRRTIQIGEPGDFGVEILGGLRAGETVIVTNLDRLRDGMQVAPSKLS